MRLIDADALKDNIRVKSGYFDDMVLYLPMSDVHKSIDKSPTIDAVSVVHGRWEVSGIPCEQFKCSECGGGCWYYDYHGDVAKSRYCPNCGARMDLEDGEA